jgi:adenine-specific DNA-methyltransferase
VAKRSSKKAAKKSASGKKTATGGKTAKKRTSGKTTDQGNTAASRAKTNAANGPVKSNTGKKKPIQAYEHADKKRVNNPPVGLVKADTDPDRGEKKTYQYDPHLDPQLVWAGKAEHTSFDVPTVSLHVHERIDPRSIIEAVRRRNGNGKSNGNGNGNGHGKTTGGGMQQMFMFEQPEENPPLREAIEFYKHAKGWKNRLIAGDSLLVMNSLLEKEGMAGKVQMVYIDPPYGIRYGSNFQPFVNKRDVKDGKDDDLTQEPEMIRAFRDTWELGIHSYLTYLRDRLLLARELLHESGSVFVQISDENIHHVRELMDEVFSPKNFVTLIYFATTGGFATGALSRIGDYLVWYCKDRQQLKYRQLYLEKGIREGGGWSHSRIELDDGTRKNVGVEEVKALLAEGKTVRPYSLDGLASQGTTATSSDPFMFDGREYALPPNSHWKTNPQGMQRLAWANRIEASTNSIRYVRFLDDFPVQPITNVWDDTNRPGYIDEKKYVVQTSAKVVERCILMATDPGDLILDPTCGSGTTAFVAERWGRRWITCDTSRVSTTLAKQRLMSALFDYYSLAQATEGISSGLSYKTVPHITLRSIANNLEIKKGMSQKEINAAIAKYADRETLYDKPAKDRLKARVSGPFTVEAVPAPGVRSLTEVSDDSQDEQTDPAPADMAVGREGESLRQDEWRDELLKCGIRGKGGQHIHFSRVEPLSGTRWLHAEAETKEDQPQRVVVSFGPEHAPLEQRQVEQALEEAGTLKPSPKMIVFASFQFDPEAAKDIDETNWPGVTMLKVQMNTDLLTDDLKKSRSSNESFWMIGQPDVVVDGEQWLVDSRKEALAPYAVVAELSGLDRLAEINGLGRDHLSMLLAIAQRRDLWTSLAVESGGSVDTGQHRGRSGQARDGGVSAFSGGGSWFVGRIGDAGDFVREIQLLSRRDREQRIERLRGSREIADRAGQIAASLTEPLSTIHYSQVTVQGFDYYNPKEGKIESGDTSKIAMWMLDTDYDGRSLYPSQVFFPMAGPKDGWARLAKNLKAEIDEDLIEAYRGTVSLPFEPGTHGRVAVKIIDDRGIESLKIVGVT